MEGNTSSSLEIFISSKLTNEEQALIESYLKTRNYETLSVKFDQVLKKATNENKSAKN